MPMTEKMGKHLWIEDINSKKKYEVFKNTFKRLLVDTNTWCWPYEYHNVGDLNLYMGEWGQEGSFWLFGLLSSSWPESVNELL